MNSRGNSTSRWRGWQRQLPLEVVVGVSGFLARGYAMVLQEIQQVGDTGGKDGGRQKSVGWRGCFGG